jgi:hypothetical protein
MYILQLADYLDIEAVVDNEVEEEDFEEEELGESVVISSIKFSDNIVQTFSMMILKRARQIVYKNIQVQMKSLKKRSDRSLESSYNHMGIRGDSVDYTQSGYIQYNIIYEFK